MNICNHIIQDSEIIGIGPVSLDIITTYLIKVRYSFLLHCRQQSIKIESQEYFFDKPEAMEMPSSFENDYASAKAKVLAYLKELE